MNPFSHAPEENNKEELLKTSITFFIIISFTLEP